MRFHTKIFTLLIIASFSFTACEDTDDDVMQNDFDAELEKQAVRDGAHMLSFFNGVSFITDQQTAREDEANGRVATDGIWTFSTNDCDEIEWNFKTQEIVFDFGTQGCEGWDGKVRTGKIVVQYNKAHWLEGAVVTTILYGYSEDNVQIEGIKVFKNLGNNLITEQVSNGKAIFPDGSSISLDYFFNRKMIAGSNTWFDLRDDRYLVDGGFSGVDQNRVSFSGQVTADNPLVYNIDCWFQKNYLPVDGNVSLISGNSGPIQVDFGGGICDKTLDLVLSNDTKVTLTLN